MPDPDYGKRITIESFDKGQLTESKQQLEIPLFCDKLELMRTIIEAVEPITTGRSRKLSLDIKLDKNNRYRIDKKWLV